MARQNFYESQLQKGNPYGTPVAQMSRPMQRFNEVSGRDYFSQMENTMPSRTDGRGGVKEEEGEVRDPNAPVTRPRPRPISMAGRVPDQMSGAFVQPQMDPPMNAAFNMPAVNPYMMQQTYMNPYMNMYGQPMQPLQDMGQNRLAFANRLLMR